jgi:hypothetical protein
MKALRFGVGSVSISLCGNDDEFAFLTLSSIIGMEWFESFSLFINARYFPARASPGR